MTGKSCVDQKAVLYEEMSFNLERSREILESHVNRQIESARLLQRWVRNRSAHTTVQARSNSVELILPKECDNLIEMVESDRENADQATSASYELAHLNRILEAEREASNLFANRERSIMAKLREDEALRRAVCKQMVFLRTHLRAWSMLVHAIAYARGHDVRLMRALWSSWLRMARKLLHLRRRATLLQCLWRGFIARRQIRRNRDLEAEMLKIALICNGRARDRQVRHFLLWWHHWSKLNVSIRNKIFSNQLNSLRMIVKKWVLSTKLEVSRRCTAISVSQRIVGETTMHRRKELAATVLTSNFKRHFARVYCNQIRKDLFRIAREKEQPRSLLGLARKIAIRRVRTTFLFWCHKAGLGASARAHEHKSRRRKSFKAWSSWARKRMVERAEYAAGDALLRRLLHGFAIRQRFLRLLQPHRAARSLQTRLARPYLARRRANSLRELLVAVIFTQRWYRGKLGRRQARAENAEQLLIAAFADDSDALIRRHTAAVTLPALASTSATVMRHSAAGDFALHKAARGASLRAAATCLETLGIGADWRNDDGRTALHVVGEALEPFNAAVKGTESQNKGNEIIELNSRTSHLTMPSNATLLDRTKNGRDSRSIIVSAERTVSLEDRTTNYSLETLSLAHLFADWFEGGVPTVSPQFHNNSPSRACGDESASHSSGISSDVSDHEAELAMLSAAEFEDWINQDTRIANMADLLISHGGHIEAVDAFGCTPLMCAIKCRNIALVKVLLDRRARIEVVDYAGDTPLTLAAKSGCVSIGRLLLRAGANPNTLGRNGRMAVHEVCRNAHRSFAPSFVRALLAAGVSLNARDERGRTPLAYSVSCRHRGKQSTEESEKHIDGHFTGSPEQLVLRLLLEGGANPSEKYQDGSTPLHLAAKANRVDAISAIIDYGDVDVSAADTTGESALHIAARTGASHALQALLRRGCDMCACDRHGNQPIHSACRGGHVETVEMLVAYDAPLGCRNWEGLTPLGVSRMHGRHQVTHYLLNCISSASLGIVSDEPDATRIATAWSSPIALPANKWIQEWSGAEGLSPVQWRNRETGQIRTVPPPDRALRVTKLCREAWPKTVLKREVAVLKDEEGTVTVGAAEYELERSEHQIEVVRMRWENDAAIAMQTRWRRLDAINLAACLRERRNAARTIQRLWRWNVSEERRRVEEKQFASAAKLQRVFRGRDSRRDFESFLWERLWWRRAERELAQKLQRLWRGYVTRRFLKRVRIRARGPQTYSEWQKAVQASGRPYRTFGIYEERFFPRSCSNHQADGNGVLRDVKFYHNRISGVCSWDQPSDWIAFDREMFEEREQLRLLGFTKGEAKAAMKLQAIWKGRRDRRNLHTTLLGAKIMRECESEYLRNPLDLRKMAHYLLYIHTMREDVERARSLYHDAMQHMHRRGPDDAWLLCSYAVFLAATGSDDWPTIVDLAEKGRHAHEGPAGEDWRSYDLAKGGFFRSATAQKPNSGWAWHNYALVLQLIYHDMSAAEECYVRALLNDPRNKILQQNFDNFLALTSSSLSSFDAIRNYSTKEMYRDMALKKKELDSLRQDPCMQYMALKVQMAWRKRNFQKLVRTKALQTVQNA